jgi:hypothetical protein
VKKVKPSKNAERKAKRQGNDPYHTPLTSIKKQGSTLVPPMAEMPVQVTTWDRDVLPEQIWIASLESLVTREHDIFRPYYALMDVLNQFVGTDDDPILGRISDFGQLKGRADEIRAKHGALLDQLFVKPIGRALAFYPECPASWIYEKSPIITSTPLDPEVELPKLRSLVVRLLDRTGSLAMATRMPMFGQIVKMGRIHFPHGYQLTEILPRYPDNCTEDERKRAESEVRASMGAIMKMRKNADDTSWAKHFWRKNYDLTRCRRVLIPVSGAKPASSEEVEQLELRAQKNVSVARAYVDTLVDQVRFDLYEPERDEILAGLFSRVVRLYVLLMQDPTLWARDTAGIILRCIAESAITFCYLAKCGTPEEFVAFRKYGEGQKKLLMLQLQDNHPDETTLEGRTAADISSELGGFTAELLQIELGNWAKKDTRKLAQEAGLEVLYRLVFTPTSADVHGTWASLKHSNLAVCREPLHRFHQLPSFSAPPLYVQTLVVAQSLLTTCHEAAVSKLAYPATLS